MIAEVLGNSIADALGTWMVCIVNLWIVTRKIRTLGKDKRCPNCNDSFAVNPRVYKSTHFLYTGPSCLTLIPSHTEELTAMQTDVKAK